MNTPSAVKDLARVAARAAKRRYRWADLGDMEQEAALAMLAALPYHRAERGALEPFLMYAAWNRLSAWAWEFGGPVRQRCDRNLGWAFAGTLSEKIRTSQPDPEEAFRRAQFARAVSRVLSRFALSVQMAITGEGTVPTLAADGGEDRRVLARSAQQGRAMLRALAEEHL